MKKFYYLLASIAIVLVTMIACEKASIELDETQATQDEVLLAKADKATICHYDDGLDEYGSFENDPQWVTIDISVNALEAHRKHGDKYDWDGDGYYPENECGIGEDLGYDCNDDIAEINPDAIEVCDGIDNNCNGEVDEDLTYSFAGTHVFHYFIGTTNYPHRFEFGEIDEFGKFTILGYYPVDTPLPPHDGIILNGIIDEFGKFSTTNGYSSTWNLYGTFSECDGFVLDSPWSTTPWF